MDADFFKNNRAKLLEKCKGAPIIVTAAAKMQQTPDDAWRFEQEANFWYLTGIEEADWLAIITPDKATLVAPYVSKVKQLFMGSLDSIEAGRISGVDEIISHDEFVAALKNLSKKHDKVYTIFPQNQIDHDFFLNPAQSLLTAKLRKNFAKVEDARPTVHRLRAIKNKDEIMMMRRAINLTIATFGMVKNELQDYIFEYEAQAKFSYEFEKVGAAHAYDPIIASGQNAVTLHYCKNRSGLAKNSTVLMDVGARYGNYCADITRTYAFGEISQRAKDIHAAVQNAQEEIIGLIKPDAAVKAYLEKSDEIMKKAIADLKLGGDWRKYFPHAISHGLGIDVHDPLGQPKTFRPGMILTVEPGIYVADEQIGVRVEDNILIKENEIENLSARLSTNL